MAILTILFTLSFLSSAARAETYCFYNSFGDVVCRERLSTAARIAIAVASFAVVFAILIGFGMYRRRKIARANMAFIPNNQQHGYANQPPPPPPQGGFFGGNGQKEQHGYDGQYNQYNGQHSPQYNPPQYPPTAYDQGHPSQPAPPYPSYSPPPGPPPQNQGNPYHV